MNPLFRVKINLLQTEAVKGKNGEAAMLLFDGSVESDIFNGHILSGGVDTQKQSYGKPRTLSARYILKGTDFTGQECKIFIENEAVDTGDGSLKTKPLIYTDSTALAYLEDLDIFGTIETIDNTLFITFYSQT